MKIETGLDGSSFDGQTNIQIQMVVELAKCKFKGMSITNSQIRTMATMTVQCGTPTNMLSHEPACDTYIVCENYYHY